MRSKTINNPFSFGGHPVIGQFILTALFWFSVIVGHAAAQGTPPAYELRFLGAGSPTAVNSQRVVVGTRTVGGNYEPLVSTGGAPWAALPVPPGSMSTIPTDINDLGVIVGVSFTPQWSASAVRWAPGAGGYVLEILPLMAGDTAAYATAINNAGQIVGSRSTLGYQPTGTGWVYSDQAGFRRLTDFGFWIVPRDINDSGLVIGGQERLDLATGQVDVTGQGPSNYQPITSIAINASGMMVGSSPLRSTSLNIVSVFRYMPGPGWEFIAGSTRYTVGYDINDLGDITFGEFGAGIFFDGLGTFAVGSLLSPETIGNGWVITGNGSYVNNSREIATIARNDTTGQNGAVLLLPIGMIPPPTAPTGLAGVPHPATRMEPFNSIELSWVNSSSLTRSWELQRAVEGSSDWETLQLIPPGTATRHSDTTVGVNITYNYRVRAIGLGGASPWSDTITLTSPPTPLDTTPPVVTLLEPAKGETVSGVVTTRSSATDNVAVEYQEISYWNQFTGQQVAIGSSNGGGEIAFNWDTTKLTPATYRVTALAYDTMGNIDRSEADVIVAGSTAGTIRVSSIRMYSERSRNGYWVYGDVSVLDNAGSPVAGATVSVRWRTPNGRNVLQTAQTDVRGVATFGVQSVAGTYRLYISGVSKTGFEFDPASSQLSARYWRGSQ